MSKDIYKKYSYKIKTVSEILKIVGSFPRKKKLAMCHGNFDVVHPGHLHHLMYVKTKSKYLIASITKDKHIIKGKNRPHVPDHLRAINLAAFEMIDFVVIDENKTPISNLKKLKPDIFAKGFEYNTALTNNPKTIEELNAINSYGGKMFFTPGDIVNSSTKLLTFSKPDIRKQKLYSLLSKYKITYEEVNRILNGLKNIKIHIVGDTIVDTYINTTVIGAKAKTPTLSVKKLSEKSFLGGAAIVATHIEKAGAKVSFTSVIGNDTNGKWVKSKLNKSKITNNLIIDNSRPTTNKIVYIADDYRMLKVDELENFEISKTIIQKISKKIKNLKVDGIIFSDFRHGIFNENTIKEFNKNIANGVFTVADSQVASRWGNITEFKSFDMITPNENEARFALGDQDSVIGRLMENLQKKTKAKNVLLKLGKNGMLVFRPSSKIQKDNFFYIDSFVENLIDPVGAGDALLAYSTLAMILTDKEPISSFIGSLAASLACEQNGNIAISKDDIIKKAKKIFDDLKKYS